MENLIKIGAAYLRVSDSRQDEYSPESQLKKIREEAQRDGVMIPDEYVFFDDGISGRSVKKRNEFNRMISIAKEKDTFDIVYVWKFSRFARSQEESIVYKSLLAKHHVTVKSVSESIPEGPFGGLIERIIEWMDEFYSIRLGEEVVRGMEEKFLRGEPTSQAPYGYRMGDKCFEVVPDEAEIVLEVFNRYANGEGARSVSFDLGNRGIMTRHGNRPDNRWITYMINNPTYIGKLRRSENRAVSKRSFDSEDIRYTDGHHDAIIEKGLWDKCQERRLRDLEMYGTGARDPKPNQYLSKGVIKCSNCGATLCMSVTSGKEKKKYLQCNSYSHAKCKESHAVMLSTIEEALLEGIEQAVKNKTFTFAVKKTPKQDGESERARKVIAQLERSLERAKQAYLSEIDTLEQYKENKTRLEAEISRTRALLNEDAQTIPEVDEQAYTEKVRGVVEFLKDGSVSVEAKNIALRAIIEKAVFNRKENTLDIYFRQ